MPETSCLNQLADLTVGNSHTDRDPGRADVVYPRWIVRERRERGGVIYGARVHNVNLGQTHAL